MIKGDHEIKNHDCFKLIIVVPGIVSMRCNEPIQSMVGQIHYEYKHEIYSTNMRYICMYSSYIIIIYIYVC